MFSIYSFTVSPTFQTVWDVHIKKSSFWGKWGQSLHYFAFFRWVTTILGWSGKIQIVKSTFLAITFEDCSCSRFCLLPGWYQTDPPDISSQNHQARKFGAKVFWCFWKMETKEQRTFFFTKVEMRNYLGGQFKINLQNQIQIQAVSLLTTSSLGGRRRWNTPGTRSTLPRWGLKVLRWFEDSPWTDFLL